MILGSVLDALTVMIETQVMTKFVCNGVCWHCRVGAV